MSLESELIGASLGFAGLFMLLSGASWMAARRALVERPFVLNGLLALAMMLASASLAAQLAGASFSLAAADFRAFATCAAAALSLDLAQELQRQPRVHLVRASYGMMLLSMLLVLLSPTTEARAVSSTLSIAGHSLRWIDAPVSLARQWVALSEIVVFLASSVSLLDAAWVQRRSVAAMGVAQLVWACTVSFDLTAWRLSIPVPRLSELAAAAFCVVALATLVSRELELREARVAEREREIHALNETLTEVRAVLSQREPLALVGELSAIVAHEVRNPIAVMMNAAASLRREALHPTDRALLLTIVEEECDRLNRIVTDLLALARPMAPQRKLVDLGEMLERSLAIARRAEVEVMVRVADGAGEPLKCDAVLFRQAIENVVANAVQAMGRGGHLSVSILRRERDGSMMREITVVDSGEGMGTEVRKNARKPFFTTRSNGTGLGLAIVERILNVHGGTLEIESARGAGTTVRLSVPEDRESVVPQS